MSFLAIAKNGCSSDLFWRGKKVYYPSSNGFPQSHLGEKLDKNIWINDNIANPASFIKLKKLLNGWELYKDGWLFKQGSNKRLFYYLCQIGSNSRPDELYLLKK